MYVASIPHNEREYVLMSLYVYIFNLDLVEKGLLSYVKILLK